MTPPEMIVTPEATNLTPITYDDAMVLYAASDRRPFSFVAAPYGVLKTIMVLRDSVVASPPNAARQHYEWLANQGSRRR